MIVGCPTEIKTRENRVGIIPASVAALAKGGHKVLVQKGAGVGSGIPDEEFKAAGADIVDKAEDVWGRADIVCKVKEPLPPEFPLLREGQILYTYLHLAPEPALTQELLKRKVSGIAYETIQVGNTLPLLKPMSEVAGKMAVQVGAWCLEKAHGGKGILLGGVPGVPRAKVLIIGGGVVGTNAAKVAVGMGAEVTIVDNSLDRLDYLEDVFLGRAQTLYSTPHEIEEQCIDSDLVIGAVLVAGARAPRLVTREVLKKMQPGSVIIDVAVDQGGCVETMKVTTHENPTFEVDGIIHYGVANMPGAVPRTSTFALNHATFPYLKKLAERGFVEAVKGDAPLASGVNTHRGQCTYRAVAEAHGIAFTPLGELLR
ncbi:MAG: alanine dehydrogenase [Deltaproteobacteria bacterium]|nr:alanine dehydrogenase [Deltaproteobacteria bacterium]